jgi:hypothetical protein
MTSNEVWLVVGALALVASVARLVRVVVAARRLAAQRDGRTTPVRGLVLVDELADGLAGLPEHVIGVGLRGPMLGVLCRRHVNRSTLAVVRARPGTQVLLLVGGPGLALGTWCLVCRGVVPANEVVETAMAEEGNNP